MWLPKESISDRGTNKLIDDFLDAFFKLRKNPDYAEKLEQIINELASRPSKETIQFIPHLNRLLFDAIKKEDYRVAATYRDLLLVYRLRVV